MVQRCDPQRERRADRRLEVFHNRCLRSILGIYTTRQRTEHISSAQTNVWNGESLEDLVSASSAWPKTEVSGD